MRENLNKYIKHRVEQLIHSSFTFSDLFEITFDQGERILAEYLELTGLKQLSYKDAKEYCYQMATYLLPKINSPKGSFVGLYMENCINWIIVFWALLMMGYKPMLLNCRLPSEINNNTIKLLNIQDIVTNKACLNNGLKANHIVLENDQIDLNIRKLNKYSPIAWGNEIGLTTTATSSNCKIAIYTGKDITNLYIAVKDVLGVNGKIKTHYKGRLKQLMLLPLYHIFGFVGVYGWFTIFGRTLVFLKDYSARTIQHTIKTAEVTHIFAVPLFWNQLAKSINKEINCLPIKKQNKFKKGIDKSIALQNVLPHLGPKIARRLFKEVIDKTFGPSIQYLISGGSYLNKDTLRLINGLGYYLTTGFGSTEASITCVELRLRPKYRLSSSVGKCLSTVDIRAVGQNLEVQGWSTCSTIIYPDGSRQDIHNTWYDLKDLGHLDKDNYLYIHGRQDDVIVSANGENINPDLIEEKLDLNFVKNFAITNLDGKTTLILQTPSHPAFILIRKIVDEVKQQVNKVAQLGFNIEQIKFTNQDLANPNAIKVSRTLLHNKIANNEIELYPFSELSKYEASSLETVNEDLNKKIKQIFGQILNKQWETIDDNAHFIFDLGGTSLDYFTLLQTINQELDTNIQVSDKSLMTVNDFSHYIQKGGQ